MGKKGGGGGGGGAKASKTDNVLGATQKAHVQTLKKMGIEDPRKFFIAGKQELGTWQDIKGAGKQLSSGNTEGPRVTAIAGNQTYAKSYERNYATQGTSDGGKLSGGFADQDLVGSGNAIIDYDGTQFSGGGGGDTGSTTAGMESAGLANVQQGQSLDDVVYGVKKRGKNQGLRKARGVGE